MFSQSNVIVLGPDPTVLAGLNQLRQARAATPTQGAWKIFLFALENISPHLLFSHNCHIISEQFYALCLRIE